MLDEKEEELQQVKGKLTGKLKIMQKLLEPSRLLDVEVPEVKTSDVGD